MCPAHLQDRHFCSPIVDAESEAARLKEQKMAEEIEKVKKEYEEKQKRKKEREKQSSKDDKDKDKEKKNDRDDSKEKNSGDSKSSDERERDDKVHSKEVIPFYCDPVAELFTLQIDSIKKGAEPKPDNGPRIFALHKYVRRCMLHFPHIAHRTQDVLPDAHRPAKKYRDGQTKPGEDEESFPLSFGS